MADFSNGYIGLSYGIQAAGQIATAYEQSQALRAQGNFQRTMAEINQQFANRQADQVIQQGSRQAQAIHRQGLQVQGAQRASAAAQGIRVDDGSAGDAVDTTRFLSADDQITARANAWREAFGIRTQAAMNVSQARFQARANDSAANATLLSGGLQALGSGMRATGYGLKAFRDMSGTSTPDPTKGMTSAQLTLPNVGSQYDNTQFDDIFGLKD